MQSFFGPSSPQAHAVAGLWWWMLGVGGAVWLIVIITMLWATFARRGQRGPDDLAHVDEATHARMERVVTIASAITVAILIAFLAYDFTVGRALAQHPQLAMTIDVTGHQWWWEVLYEDPDPSRRLVTANEIHVPVGVPIQFKLRAADVIHSFWAPNLNGKKDLIPGYTTTLWFKADTAGTYRGQCAEFCGLQHAKMAFYVVAEPKVKFASWLAAASQAPPPPTDPHLVDGQRVFLSAGCAVCHTIAGTQARATVGPDLTHLGSRKTIASGTLANTRANLLRWIIDPSTWKPGARMPAVPLSPGQQEALADYLESMK